MGYVGLDSGVFEETVFVELRVLKLAFLAVARTPAF
jgi:hypothetical protein